MGPESRDGRSNEAATNGNGELWFDSPAAIERAMKSPQMAAAVEDTKRFLDIERTYALIVDETTVFDE